MDSKGKLLVVDDEPNVIQPLEIMLKECSYAVSTALSGREALNLLGREDFDIMLTDIKMPGMDGLELMSRAQKLNSDMQCIVFTGYGEMDVAIKAMRMGAINFIRKPFAFGEMEVAIERGMEKRRLILELKENQERLEKANRELAQEVNKNKMILDAAGEGILGLDAQGKITFINFFAAHLLKLDVDEPIGRSFHELTRHSKPDGSLWPEDECPVCSFFKSKTLRSGTDEVFYRMDGTGFSVEYVSTPLVADGKTIGAVVVFRDYTERLKTEKARLEAVDAAEQANRLKSEFLANMSHEVRTPMNGIIGMTDLVLKTDLSLKQREYLDMVKISADNLLAVLNDILDFSKIEAGKLNIEPISFRLRIMVGECLKMLAVKADRKGIKLSCRIHDDVADDLIGDPGRLRQILINLVDNGIKFTEKGEVDVQVKMEEKGEDDTVLLHFLIRDTGIGVPRKKHKMIFEAFTQADGSMTRKHGGTGLGLSISCQLVKMMGGNIWAEDAPGGGALFHFTSSLKLLEVPFKKQEQPSFQDISSLSILVVDDFSTNRDFLEKILIDRVRSVETADSGKAALVLLKERRFDIVVLDARMSGLDGFSVAQKIRDDPDLSRVIVIMLTSAGQRGDAARCRESGISAYLMKPVNMSDLLNSIRTVVYELEQKGEPQPLITRHSLREQKGIPLNILLAEDDYINRTLTILLIENLGWEVTAVENGNDVLSALEDGRFDLVLMDVQMPELNGLETTMAIRAKEKETGEHLPIIALTAHAMKDDREECLNAGMDDYICKPIEFEEFRSTILKAIKK
ncbi:MAG: response regulator [Desulfobulbaceae bacterium]|nr:response regulator [Desulfobulbaceae bacterium]